MNLFDEIKNKLSISQVYQDITGENILDNQIEIRLKCKNTNESTPSLFINTVKDVFNCFSCGAGGSIIDLTMHETDFNEPLEAAKWLADRYNIEYDDSSLTHKEYYNNEYFQISLQKFINDCHNNLQEDHRRALNARGISNDTINKFKIGFCLGRSQTYLKSLKKDNIQLYKEYMTIGLIGKNDFFLPGGRIIIPFYNYGKPVYWVAWNAKSSRKYINPKNVPIPIIINRNSNNEPFYLVEGAFDFLSMAQAELNTICTFGTSINLKYLKRFKKIKDLELFIAYDNDDREGIKNTGLKASEKICLELWPQVKASFITFPKNKDVNDLWIETDNSKDNFLKELYSLPCETILSNYISIVNNASEEKKNIVAKKAYPLIACLSGVEREYQIKKLQNAFGDSSKITLKALEESIASSNKTINNNNNIELNLSTKLYKLIKNEAYFFTDQREIGYAKIYVEDHWEIWPINSKRFTYWLWDKSIKVNKNNLVNNEVISNVKKKVSADAFIKGDKVYLYNRVAKHNNAFWYDLSDDMWRSIRVDKNGWRILNSPIIFKRYSHQKPQVIPVSPGEGDPWRFMNFVNVKNEKDKLKLMVSIISYFIPAIPHVNLIIHGPQGSAKSTLQRYIRKVVDPSQTPLLMIPNNQKDVIQTLDHHYCAFFDNLSNISKNLSDIFCRAITGEGIELRALFTDDDSFIRNYRRCISMTGINVAATESDLLDRSVLIELETIDSNERKEESVLNKEFDDSLPVILGGILDTVSKAMKNYNHVKLESTPRMADFTNWGYAIAEALEGITGLDFLNIYTEDEYERNREVLETNNLGIAIMKLMESNESWQGTASELLVVLNNIAEREKINTYAKEWPSNINWVTRRLTPIKTVLQNAGIEYKLTRTTNERKIFLSFSK